MTSKRVFAGATVSVEFEVHEKNLRNMLATEHCKLYSDWSPQHSEPKGGVAANYAFL
jgi:acyl dehydratase